MSKLSIVLVAMFAAGLVNAQTTKDAVNPELVNAPSFGALTTPVIIGGTITAGVIAAAASNAQGDSIPPVPPVVLKCDGTDPLVNGLCVGTRQETKVTVTGSGTGTSTATRTTTISVPVTFTYAPK